MAHEPERSEQSDPDKTYLLDPTALLAKVHAFSETYGLTVSTICRYATGNSDLLVNMKRGRVTLRVCWELEKWMEGEAAKRDAAAKKDAAA